MANYNRVIIAGNLTKDPEYKIISNQPLCRLNIASNRQFKNKQTGSLIQDVCYIEIDVWGPQAENCKQYLQKGRSVLVEGRLKLETWESEGQTKRKHIIVADKVIFLSSNNNVETINDKDKKDNTNNTIDILFKDEPPFDEDLPF
jgi:single-strand DNA-binding protein